MEKIDEQTKARIIKMLEGKRNEFFLEFNKTRTNFREEISSNARRTSAKDRIADSVTPSINGNRLGNLTKCLERIDGAIEKAKKGTYGICENCGGQIPLGRLQLVPWTRYCVECKNSLSNGRVRPFSRELAH
jgi:RNA polymerase-binding transcription factor DksA